MADIIIKTKTGEVIPAIQPDAFGAAVGSLEKFNEDMLEVERKARALPKIFADKSDYDKAAVLTAERKSIEKQSDAVMTPFEELVKKVKQFIQQQKLIVSNRGQVIKGILEPAMAEFDERDKREAEAERVRAQQALQQRLQLEAAEKAQKDAEAAEARRKERVAFIRSEYARKKITKRQAEQFLREAGATEEADKAKIAADQEDAERDAALQASKLQVKPLVGPTAGVTRRTNYTAECIDPKMFLTALVIACEKKDIETRERLLEMIEVSNQKLAAKARELQNDAEMERLYPFVKASHKKTF